MGTCTIQASTAKMMELKQRLKDAEIRKTPPYALYQIKTSDCVITAYESGKVVFQGNGAEECAALLSPSAKPQEKKTAGRSRPAYSKEIYPQAGSDEVGTGDYFGPVTVCATYVTAQDVEFLREQGIQDSKAIDDTAIRRMAPKLIERLPHSLLILDNATYNRIHGENNMVAIKSRMHNQAYVHLRKKLGALPEFCIIDQFVQKSSYYRYLQKERDVVYDIHFETKAENKYLSVAAGSIIARYAFLKSFDAMCERYDFTFLKGAGSKVDANIRDFVAIHGKEALFQVAKLHFANTKKALG